MPSRSAAIAAGMVAARWGSAAVRPTDTRTPSRRRRTARVVGVYVGVVEQATGQCPLAIKYDVRVGTSAPRGVGQVRSQPLADRPGDEGPGVVALARRSAGAPVVEVRLAAVR